MLIYLDHGKFFPGFSHRLKSGKRVTWSTQVISYVTNIRHLRILLGFSTAWTKAGQPCTYVGYLYHKPMIKPGRFIHKMIKCQNVLQPGQLSLEIDTPGSKCPVSVHDLSSGIRSGRLLSDSFLISARSTCVSENYKANILQSKISAIHCCYSCILFQIIFLRQKNVSNLSAKLFRIKMLHAL